ncbi:MAG: C4-type zinc ribbon domain-containing protein [Chthoniobacteraceae bacterium]|jgi:predicted  nucleic acid-binding Zn-ribbon protein
MLQDIERLLILQDRDQKIRILRLELKNLPGERASLDAALAQGSSKLEAAKQRARDIELEKKKLEMEAQAKRDSIAKFKTQQFQTRKNEEYQALSNEIKRFEGEIEKIEDREIELMEEAEKMKGTVGDADKQHAATKAHTEWQIAEIKGKVAAIEAQVAELDAERAKLSEGIDEDLLYQYNKLFANKGGLAVVALEHETCMGCHMKLTTQTAVRVKGGKEILNCEQCGRLLYYSE